MDIINKKKLKDEVFASLQKAIVEGELKPGERIVETKIAADMGVSQATVREALKELEFYGLTENISYQGTYVKRLTKNELREAYDAREVLEEYAVGEAARRITKSRLQETHTFIEKMNEAAEKGDISSFVNYDVRFHEIIICSSGNKVIEKLWNLVNVSLYTHVTANLSGRTLDNLSRRHASIYEALENGDSEGARHVMRKHLSELRDEILAKMEAGGEGDV